MKKKIVIKSLCLALAMYLSACRSEVLEGLDESEANEIMVRLSATGIDGRKVRTGNAQGATYAVTVPTEQMSRAVQSLNAVGLPRARHDGFREVYKDRALVPGKFEEQAVFISALQEELSATLESVQGVLWSRVHVTLRPRAFSRGLGKPKSSEVQSASVLLGYVSQGDQKTPLSESQVQKLVANAVDGLEPSEVAVVFSAVSQAPVAAYAAAAGESRPGMLRWALGGLALMALGIAAVIAGRKSGLLSRLKGASA